MPVQLPIYLDNQATTRPDPRVLEAMLPYLTSEYGNAASRSHVFGWKAEAAVKEAREALAESLGAQAKELVFTSGATEANNLAILGAARLLREKGDHVVTSAIEHKAVLDPCRALEAEGFRVTVLPPDREGFTTVESVAAALEPGTVLVSVMAANNEIGTLNPVGAIGALCREKGILFHTDAAQAFGKVSLDVSREAFDLLSLSAHKIYGPKGVGALWVRSSAPRVRLAPILHGGGHERGLRSGTLDVPACVGFGVAARLALAEREREASRLAALRDRLLAWLRDRLGGVSLNGPAESRLPGNLNVSFAGIDADALMMAVRDVAVSSGSACTSASLEPSHVLRGIGRTPEEAKGSIRFGLGRFTTEEEVDFTAAAFAAAVSRLRAERPVASPAG